MKAEYKAKTAEVLGHYAHTQTQTHARASVCIIGGAEANLFCPLLEAVGSGRSACLSVCVHRDFKHEEGRHVLPSPAFAVLVILTIATRAESSTFPQPPTLPPERAAMRV